MSKGLHRALDHCLSALDQGQPLSTCLERYPEKRTQLRPLLSAAIRLRRRAALPQLDPAAYARIHDRVLAQARQRALALEAAPARSWSIAQRWRLAPSALIVPGAVVLLLGLFSGGSVVSAHSLPGDPLYVLKRASENLRMALLHDSEQRAALARRYEELRLNEVLAVVDQQRTVRVDFSGPVEQAHDGTVVVQGLEVLMDDACALDGPPAVGARVHVVAETQADGSVRASAITLIEAAQPPATATPAPPSETLARTGDARDTGSPPSATPSPRAPTPTAEVRATPSPEAPQPAADEPTEPPVAREPTAKPAPPAPQTPQLVKPLPGAAATHVPPGDVGAARIHGEIGAIDGDVWVVAGQRFLVSAETRINPPHVSPAVGLMASVHAAPQPDGQLLAVEITLLPNPPQEPGRPQLTEVVNIAGSIEALSEAEWTVAGRTVSISAATQIEGVPTLGAQALVRATVGPDGQLTALWVRVAAPEAPESPSSAAPTPAPGPRFRPPDPPGGPVRPHE